MHWSCWVKRQLRKYLCKDLLREELLQHLKDIDDDIQISSMRLSGMPRSSSPRSSSVERQAENRENIREKIQQELYRLDKTCEHIACALQMLRTIERVVIQWCYFSVEYDENELASKLGMNLPQLQEIKETALASLHSCLYEQGIRDKRLPLERSRDERIFAQVTL